MNIDRYRDHTAISFDDSDSVHRLALKKLINIDYDVVIPVSAFYKNGNIRLLYSIEGLRSLSILKDQLQPDNIIDLLHDLGRVLKFIEDDAFISREMIDLSIDNIYYDPEKGSLKVCIIPMISPDQEAGAFTWNSKLFDILIEAYKRITDLKPSENDMPLYDAINDLYNAKGSEASAKYICLEKVLEELGNEIEVQDESKYHVCDDQLIEIRYKGDSYAFSFYVMKDYFVIGKEEGCDGCIRNNSAISRKHCVLERHDGHLYISDLGSLNHTYVNRHMLESGEKVMIKDHDILRIADMDFEIVF